MADVNITPKVRCDNCGIVADKVTDGHVNRMYARPRTWGSARMEGGRSADSYGGKTRLDFIDLCPDCANTALDAAAAALREMRGEGAET